MANGRFDQELTALNTPAASPYASMQTYGVPQMSTNVLENYTPNADTLKGFGYGNVQSANLADAVTSDTSTGGNDWNWLGEGGVAIPGIKALTGLGSLYLGSQALKEQRSANKFNQGVTRTNLANQAKLLNQQLADRYAARQAQAGTGAGTEGYADRLAAYKASSGVSGKVG